MAREIPWVEYTPPSMGVLVQESLDFLRLQHPKEWKKSTPEERQKYAEDRAALIKSEAESLIATGMPEESAWNRAKKSMNLGSDSD